MEKTLKLYIVLNYDSLDGGDFVGVFVDKDKADDCRKNEAEKPEVAFSCVHTGSVLVSDVLKHIGESGGEEKDRERGKETEKAEAVQPEGIHRKSPTRRIQKNANVSRRQTKS